MSALGSKSNPLPWLNTIIVDSPDIDCIHKDIEQVANACIISSYDDICRNIVTSLADPFCHSVDRILGCMKPEENDVNHVLLSLCTMHKVDIRTRGKRRLYGEGFVSSMR